MVLPAPLGPRRARNAPRGRTRSSPARAGRPPNAFATPRSSAAAPAPRPVLVFVSRISSTARRQVEATRPRTSETDAFPPPARAFGRSKWPAPARWSSWNVSSASDLAPCSGRGGCACCTEVAGEWCPRAPHCATGSRCAPAAHFLQQHADMAVNRRPNREGTRPRHQGVGRDRVAKRLDARPRQRMGVSDRHEPPPPRAPPAPPGRRTTDGRPAVRPWPQCRGARRDSRRPRPNPRYGAPAVRDPRPPPPGAGDDPVRRRQEPPRQPENDPGPRVAMRKLQGEDPVLPDPDALRAAEEPPQDERDQDRVPAGGNGRSGRMRLEYRTSRRSAVTSRRAPRSTSRTLPGTDRARSPVGLNTARSTATPRSARPFAIPSRAAEIPPPERQGTSSAT